MAILVLAIAVLALVAFWAELFPLEVTSLLVVCSLAATGVLTPKEAFAGFADETVVFIFTLLAMAQGLASTGVVQLATSRLGWLARLGRRGFILTICTFVATFSAFVSNTVTTAAFLPVTVAAAARAKVSKREVLMPMAFASMLGGTTLLIGTSTNLVMSAVIARAGLQPIGMAELFPVGILLATAGIALLVLFAPRMLRAPPAGAARPAMPSREYLTEVVLPEESPHLGRSIADLAGWLGVRVLAIVRHGQPLPAHGEHPVGHEDRLLVEAGRDEIVTAKHLPGVAVEATPVDAPATGAPETSTDDDYVLIEASVPPGSRLAGRSLEQAQLARRFGFEALAIHRRPSLQRMTRLQLLARSRGASTLGSLPLTPGDVVLLRGRRERVQDLADGALLLLLSGVDENPLRPRKALLAIAIFAGALVAGGLDVLPLAVAGLAGMLAMIVTRCLDSRSAFGFDWRIVLMIASMMALALAMEKSGAGALLGNAIAGVGSFAGPRGVLAALVVLTMALSVPMSNQAAALVVFPIAMSAASRLAVDPRPLAIGITLAASIALVTPFEPSSMLVYGVGRYRFADYVRVGAPITLALVVILVAAVPVVWPFLQG
jgi:di/tricarboxylate transporter